MTRRFLFLLCGVACLFVATGCSPEPTADSAAPAVPQRTSEAKPPSGSSSMPAISPEQQQRGNEMARGYSQQYGNAAAQRGR
jgi:hypothetical protein